MTSSPHRRIRVRTAAGGLAAVLAITAAMTAVPALAHADASPTATSAVAVTDIPVVDDDMDRTVSTGWGSSADGAWCVIEGASSVTGDQALLASRAPGITARATTEGVAATDVTSRFSLTVPTLPVGGPLYLAQAVRVSGHDSYGVRVRVHPDGSAYLSIVRLTDLTAVDSLAERRLPLTVSNGSTLNVALSVTGTDPVALSAKAWPADAEEPADWQVSHTDSSSSRIQSEGGYAFALYTSTGREPRCRWASTTCS
ncbi:hypothetical protein [Microbacterium sp. Se5.02b]|uniref:hypothetical protein n=1 Tax=Microbacterium sp. Se5.02b TaxID=2864103 RepID=UPI001C6924AA|nr:hypothetical protein [Microbacterium sp. Se5.02b]QYM64911.1 hypothetical protein K1X59_03320 [Microbacterium sp. Se5.02b]